MKFSYVYKTKYLFLILILNCLLEYSKSTSSFRPHDKIIHQETHKTETTGPITLSTQSFEETKKWKNQNNNTYSNLKGDNHILPISTKYKRIKRADNNPKLENKNLSFPPSFHNRKNITKQNFKPIVALNYAQRNAKPNDKYKEAQQTIHYVTDQLLDDDIYYSLNSTSFKTLDIPAKTSLKVVILSIDKKYSDFLVVQVHSVNYKIILSYDKHPVENSCVNSTSAGLVVFVPKSSNYSTDPTVYIHNFQTQPLSVLLLVRNYTNKEPIPGGLFSPNFNSTQSIPHPYLFLNQNLLTTWISFPLSSLYNITNPNLNTLPLSSHSEHLKPIPITPSKSIKYEVYLAYMYEKDLHLEQFWGTVIKTSTVEGVRDNAKKVIEIDQIKSNWIHELFVAYAGVGTVVSVVASFNGSEGVLYTSSVFFGCDYMQMNCSMLASPLARAWCGILPFIGFFLLFFGHRFLNFTMFTAGLLASWFVLFVIFIHVPNRNMEVLGACTLVGALLGGIGWLVVWHKYHRPFYSALLIILLSSLFTAMISTHFLKYALVPTRHNIAAFVVFPIAFSVTVVGYSIFDIKKVRKWGMQGTSRLTARSFVAEESSADNGDVIVTLYFFQRTTVSHIKQGGNES